MELIDARVTRPKAILSMDATRVYVPMSLPGLNAPIWSLCPECLQPRVLTRWANRVVKWMCITDYQHVGARVFQEVGGTCPPFYLAIRGSSLLEVETQYHYLVLRVDALALAAVSLLWDALSGILTSSEPLAGKMEGIMIDPRWLPWRYSWRNLDDAGPKDPVFKVDLPDAMDPLTWDMETAEPAHATHDSSLAGKLVVTGCFVANGAISLAVATPGGWLMMPGITARDLGLEPGWELVPRGTVVP